MYVQNLSNNITHSMLLSYSSVRILIKNKSIAIYFKILTVMKISLSLKWYFFEGLTHSGGSVEWITNIHMVTKGESKLKGRKMENPILVILDKNSKPKNCLKNSL